MDFHGRIEKALWGTAELLADRPFVNGRKDSLYKHPTKGYIRYFASLWQNETPETYRYLNESEAQDLYDSFYDEDIVRPF